MTYSTAEARAEMLEEIGAAADDLAIALACLTEAYETLDDDAADALERDIFRPVQSAYGRLRRTHTEFASRYDLPQRTFAPRSPGAHSSDPKVYIERSVDSAAAVEEAIAALQDSLRPVDVGDPELRAGLSETRSLLADVPAHSRRMLRTFGR